MLFRNGAIVLIEFLYTFVCGAMFVVLNQIVIYTEKLCCGNLKITAAFLLSAVCEVIVKKLNYTKNKIEKGQ